MLVPPMSALVIRRVSDKGRRGGDLLEDNARRVPGSLPVLRNFCRLRTTEKKRGLLQKKKT